MELQQHITYSVVFSCEYVVHETQTDPPVVAKTFRRSQRFISLQATVILSLTYYHDLGNEMPSDTGYPKLPCWMQSNSPGEKRPAKNHLAENGDERGGGDRSSVE